MSKIRNIIFDIGNVLIDFDWDGHIKRICGDLSEEALYRINFAAWGNNRWDKFDLGIDAREVISEMLSYAPEYSKEMRALFANFGDCFIRRDSTIPWLQNLKSRGYKVYYLSNYSHIAIESNRECLDFLPLMDGGIFSCDVHVIKPNREIYALLAEKYNLVPDECVFIDDLERNVQGARDFGFAGIRCVSVKQVQEDLNKMLAE